MYHIKPTSFLKTVYEGNVTKNVRPTVKTVFEGNLTEDVRPSKITILGGIL